MSHGPPAAGCSRELVTEVVELVADLLVQVDDVDGEAVGDAVRDLEQREQQQVGVAGAPRPGVRIQV